MSRWRMVRATPDGSAGYRLRGGVRLALELADGARRDLAHGGLRILQQRLELMDGIGGARRARDRGEIGRAHVLNPVTRSSRMPSFSLKKKNKTSEHEGCI